MSSWVSLDLRQATVISSNNLRGIGHWTVAISTYLASGGSWSQQFGISFWPSSWTMRKVIFIIYNIIFNIPICHISLKYILPNVLYNEMASLILHSTSNNSIRVISKICLLSYLHRNRLSHNDFITGHTFKVGCLYVRISNLEHLTVIVLIIT